MKIGQKVYICGFPKSGLHLAELLGFAVAGPVKPKNWLGSFDDNAWTTKWVDIDRYIQRVKEHPPGTMLKGHTGYHPMIEQAFYKNGTAVVFVYRDLRDVAVSQAYHVLSDKDSRVHPNKALYQNMDSFENVLSAVICGVDEYPGLFERWNIYAGWLKPEWVLKITFEEMRLFPRKIAEWFIYYVYHRTADHYGLHIQLDKSDVQKRVDEAVYWITGNVETATRRKGEIGEWRKYFTPRIKREFKERGGNWIVDLGYELDNSW